MRTRRIVRFAAVPLLLAGLGAVSSGCSTANPVDQLGCSEFSTTDFSAIASLSLDANVKAFLDGAARLSALGDGMVTTVGDACANIAKAGGAMDTWSTLMGSDRTNEACKQAQAQITAALMG